MPGEPGPEQESSFAINWLLSRLNHLSHCCGRGASGSPLKGLSSLRRSGCVQDKSAGLPGTRIASQGAGIVNSPPMRQMLVPGVMPGMPAVSAIITRPGGGVRQQDKLAPPPPALCLSVEALGLGPSWRLSLGAPLWGPWVLGGQCALWQG